MWAKSLRADCVRSLYIIGSISEFKHTTKRIYGMRFSMGGTMNTATNKNRIDLEQFSDCEWKKMRSGEKVLGTVISRNNDIRLL